MDESYRFAESVRREGDAELDAAAPIENDGRSQTRTGFDPSDAPNNDSVDWGRLNKLNDGVQARERSSQNHKSDVRRVCQTITAQLDVPRHGRERALHLIDQLSLQFGSYRYEETVLAIVTLVVRQQFGWFDVETRDVMKDFYESFDTSPERVRRLRTLVQKRLDE